jgi:DNA polymerase-3 subunit epsilon
VFFQPAACFQYKIKECDGAHRDGISEEYNLRVSAFITNNSFENQNMVIVEKGRTVNERSAVLVENGVYKGYTFYDLNYQITNIEILKTYLMCKITVILAISFKDI